MSRFLARIANSNKITKSPTIVVNFPDYFKTEHEDQYCSMIINITGPAATQIITGWHSILFILPYCTIALRLFVAFYYILFYCFLICLLFIFSEFSLRATMLVNLNLMMLDSMLHARQTMSIKYHRGVE